MGPRNFPTQTHFPSLLLYKTLRFTFLHGRRSSLPYYLTSQQEAYEPQDTVPFGCPIQSLLLSLGLDYYELEIITMA